ncbi:MAG: hypothetical protein HGA61_01925 [Candidatus Moranbacteria bacterium]|nr:hypothetical protein [Candidatus Moranbacteria bacterium]
MYENHADFVRAVERKEIAAGVYSVRMMSGEVCNIKLTTQGYYYTEVRV